MNDDTKTTPEPTETLPPDPDVSDLTGDPADGPDPLAGDPGPEPAPVDDDPPEHPAHDDLERRDHALAYRVLFLEAALSNLVYQLEAQGIMPPDFKDKLIERAEASVDTRGDVHRRQGGRSNLIAAFLDADE